MILKKLKHFIENSESIEVPWFGQLMMGPQLLAYFYQIYMWGKIYHVELELNKALILFLDYLNECLVDIRFLLLICVLFTDT